MTQISKAGFNTTYADSAGTFANNTTRLISEGDMRQQGEDIKDSVMFILDHFIDEDSFASDSATKAPSQQSVKAYVDTRIRRATVNIAGGATLRSLGSSPQTLIAAPGANKFLSIHKIIVSYNYGTVAYDFSNIESLQFEIGAGNACGVLDYSIMNSGSDFNATLANYTGGSPATLFLSSSNTVFRVTTVSGTDATTGDGDLDLVIYYTIENVNT